MNQHSQVERTIALPNGTEITIREESGVLFIGGLSLHEIALPIDREALLAIVGIIEDRLNEDFEQRTAAKKRGVKPHMQKATREQLDLAREAYRRHCQLCRESGIAPAEPNSFALQYLEVQALESKEPEDIRDKYEPFRSYGQYQSPKWMEA